MAGQPLPHVPIDGVALHALTPHGDARGRLVELYRESWDLGVRPVQFNVVASEAGVMRGVHVHVRHLDYLFVAAGRMTLGMHDVRPWSPSLGASCQIELDAAAARAVTVPPGVAHGFYFPVPSLLVYGVSHYWNQDDEIACRWDSPELGIAWPAASATVSDRDAKAPGYGDFVAAFLSAWRATHGALPERSAQ